MEDPDKTGQSTTGGSDGEHLSAGGTATFKASRAQERLLVLRDLDPSGSTYNMALPWRIRGHLDSQALEQALDYVVRQHESLRTTFSFQDDRHVQIIHPPSDDSAPLLRVDLTAIPRDRQADELAALLNESIFEPFDLENGPVFRHTLFRLARDEHVLLLSMHHAVSDAWSMSVIYKDVARAYTAFRQGEAVAVTEPEITYADYAEWQTECIETGVWDDQFEYWRTQLANLPDLDLPTDAHPSGTITNSGRRVSSAAMTETEGLRQLAADEQGTMFMALLAGLQVLLHRYTGQEDFGIGSPIAGRGETELENVVGFFVNTLTLRTRISADMTFREVLRQARTTVLESFDNQDVPFDLLVEELSPRRHAQSTPFFKVMFMVQQSADGSFDLEDLETEILSTGRDTARFDLLVVVTLGPDGMRFSIEYRTDLFRHERIQSIMDHLGNLLQSAAAEPDRPIGELEVMSADERHALLVEANRTTTEYPRSENIVSVFRKVAQNHRESPAMILSDGSQVTYAKLDTQSDAVASRLISLGVQPGDRVGIALGRSAELAAGILGILKAGAAYLPVDVDYPAPRIEFMLKDGSARVVLADGDFEAPCPVVSIAEAIAWEISPDLPADLKPGNLAYVMYTSGSTGEPKGVCITHQNVLRLVLGTRYARFEPDERFLMVASPSFDASTYELWGAFLNGGACVVYPGRVPALDALANTIRIGRATSAFMTTSLFNTIIDNQPQLLDPLNLVLVGGEALSVPHMAKAVRELPNTRIFNVYGPTESTTFTTYWPIARDLSPDAPAVPIGKPIANTTLFVLDAQGEPVPPGIDGELYIGGDGLADGYLGREELTAERFVVNERLTGTPIRLYRTGDRVRIDRDGLVDYRGRFDDQVKIRGFRIEPGELTHAAAGCPGVRDSQALVVENQRGDKELVLFATGDADSDQIVSWLSERLPPYMIPSRTVVLETMPLTGGGKIDRRALADMRTDDDAGKGAEASSDAEREMLEVWRSVLDKPELGVEENFFESGGHSLLAVATVHRIQSDLNIQIELADLFSHPTVRALVRSLETQGPAQTDTGFKALVPMQTKGSLPNLFSVHLPAIAPHLSADQPLYWLNHLIYEDPPDNGRVESVARFYLEEVRRVQPRGPYYLCGFSYGGMVAWHMARLLENEGEQVRYLGLVDATPPGFGDRSGWKRALLKSDGKGGLKTGLNVGFIVMAVRGRARRLWRRLQGLVSQVQGRALTPRAIMHMHVRIFTKAARMYRYPQLSCPVDLFLPGDIDVKSAAWPWRQLLGEKLRVREIPGISKHLKLIEEPSVERVSEQIQSTIRRRYGQ